MSSRLKSLGFGSKRKSSANIQPTSVASPNGSTSTTGTPPPPSASQTSLPPMNQPGIPGRPPSYTYNNVQGRPQSPMPPGQTQMAHHPPPIDTRAGYVGGAPQLGPPQPPGYGGAYGQMAPQPGTQPLQNQFGPARPAEVEGAGRSKAQLIVGIDFVRPTPKTLSDSQDS